MKYTVSAVCIIRKPNEEYEISKELSPKHDTASSKEHSIRDEVIDTDKNEIFKDCKNEYAVEDRYEEYWNRLNGGYKNSEIVKVVNVVKEEESK